MAHAFQCDRCKQTYQGAGSLPVFMSEFAWEPTRHSYPCTIHFSVDNFKSNSESFAIQSPDLCKECVATLMRLAADKVYKE